MTEPEGDPQDRSGTRALGDAPAPTEPEVGAEIDDFLLVDELGEGAFAKVYLAHQKSLRRTVALKISTAKSEEAQTLAQLDHPNIVRVFDQRQVPGRELHLLYMEYVPAGTLEPVIERITETPAPQRSGKLLLEIVDAALAKRGAEPPLDSMLRERLQSASWSDAVAILGSHLAIALDYAHGQNVLHRDVKPANVLLESTGRAKLADFNISWSSEVGGSASEYMGGSLPYMSPEQLAAASPFHEGAPEDLDHRSDIYGLGVVLWELLTGALPLPEPEQGQGWEKLFGDLVDSRQAGVPPAVIDALPDDVPAMLRDILLDCLTADLDKRPQSGAELARRFELCLHPGARALLTPSPSRWHRTVRRFPLLSILLTALVVNGLLAFLNVQYNAMAVVNEGEDWKDFDTQVSIVNGIGFPLGIGFLVWFALPLTRAVRRRERGELPVGQEAVATRRRSLRIGGAMVAMLLPLWIVGGLVFPVWHHARTGTAHVEAYFHFTLSNLLFGILAAMISFFLVNRLITHVLLPRLIRPGDIDVERLPQLQRLHGNIRWYFTACTLVPFVSVMVLTLAPDMHRAAFGALGIAGAVGFGIAYALSAAIRRDLEALQFILGPRRGRYGAAA